MAEPQLLARMHHAIMSGIVRDGRAPHYTELASELDGRGVPGFWVRPDTDFVESCAPFSNIPTQYLISVEGEQKWYGQ